MWRTRHCGQLASLWVVAVTSVVGVICVDSTACAQGLEMKPSATLEPLPSDPQVQVLHADPVNPADWPATLVFRNPLGGGCTATSIGQQVILTAAHCIGDGSSGHVAVNGKLIEIKCDHHPSYPEDTSADFALCFARQPLPKPIGNSVAGFEAINSDPRLLVRGERLWLLGYGCLTAGGHDHTFGSLYGGWANIDSLPADSLYTVARGGAAVCFGDSGGGVFIYTTPAQTKRRLVAVNSRGDISQYSWLSATSTTAFLDWADSWAQEKNTQICGLHREALDCAS